jgi:surface polysaccharide O-acyltransferase-like enzyme
VQRVERPGCGTPYTVRSMASVTLPHAPRDARVNASRVDLPWVSWLRSVAICGVVVIHVASATLQADPHMQTRRGLAAGIISLASKFAVPAFVMISGALLLDHERYRGPRDFLRRRALRLVPALCVWHVVYLAWDKWFLHRTIDRHNAVLQILTGNVSPPLYYFWIILGLAAVTPVLIPWVAQSSRAAICAVGAAFSMIPMLTFATRGLRNVSLAWIETPWTWWIPYLGFYLLGWGLRGVSMRRWHVVSAAVATLLVATEIIWQWRGLGVPTFAHAISGASYYGVGVHVFGVLAYVLAQGITRPAGRVVTTVGNATLGTFAVHVAVMGLVVRSGVFGEQAIAPTGVDLILRIFAVLALTLVVVMALQRIPYIRHLV